VDGESPGEPSDREILEAAAVDVAADLGELPELVDASAEVPSNGLGQTLAPAEGAAEAPAEAEQSKDPFEEIDFGSVFDDYLDPGYKSPASEVIEKPSFETFLATPTSLSDHLSWQLSLVNAKENVARAADLIIGNLNDGGYLTVSLEEIAQ